MIEFRIGKREREASRGHAVGEVRAVFACLYDQHRGLAAAVCEAVGEEKTGDASYV